MNFKTFGFLFSILSITYSGSALAMAQKEEEEKKYNHAIITAGKTIGQYVSVMEVSLEFSKIKEAISLYQKLMEDPSAVGVNVCNEQLLQAANMKVSEFSKKQKQDKILFLNSEELEIFANMFGKNTASLVLQKKDENRKELKDLEQKINAFTESAKTKTTNKSERMQLLEAVNKKFLDIMKGSDRSNPKNINQN